MQNEANQDNKTLCIKGERPLFVFVCLHFISHMWALILKSFILFFPLEDNKLFKAHNICNCVHAAVLCKHLWLYCFIGQKHRTEDNCKLGSLVYTRSTKLVTACMRDSKDGISHQLSCWLACMYPRSDMVIPLFSLKAKEAPWR